MTAPRTYSAFGLTIASDIALDALDPVAVAPDAADLQVRRATGIVRTEHGPVDPWFDITPDTQYLFWRAIGGYLIQDARTVLVEPLKESTDHMVSQALLGLVLSLVLERRQILCLHAGAVDTGTGAAVLMGDKGAGKSTTSAAMILSGHTPVTDDLVAVDIPPAHSAPPMIRPGFSSLKLWPDSIAALALAPESSDRKVHPLSQKLQKRMPVAIRTQDTMFSAAFVLDRTSDVIRPKVTRLPPHEALQNVLRFTFMARYGETRLGTPHLVAHMKRCSALVSRVPIYRLRYPADLTALDQLATTIAETTERPPVSWTGSGVV